MVTVECEAQAGALVMLSGGVPARLPGPRAQLQLNASAEDNGRIFFCSALLEVAGQVLHKNQTRELRVLCEWSCWTMTPNPQDPTPKAPGAPVLWGSPPALSPDSRVLLSQAVRGVLVPDLIPHLAVFLQMVPD